MKIHRFLAAVLAVASLAAAPALAQPIPAGGGSAAAVTQQTEDAAHSSGAKGAFMLCVRADTAASTAGSNGDYAGVICDASGRTWTHAYAADGDLVSLGAIGDSAWSGTGNGSAIAVLKAIRNLLNGSLTVGLPTGAATAALQGTGNTSLGNIDGDLGAAADSTCGSDTGSCSMIALLKRNNERLTSLLTDTSPVPVSIAAATTGGCTPGVYRSAASNNSTLIASGARTLCKLVLINTTASVYYARFYDAGSAPTCSSGTGEVASYPIPASTTGAGVVVSLGPYGEAYGAGLGFCITGGGAANDNTSAATGVTLAYSYK